MLLLDTTLRDGSYVINFQFSADDTANIASELDASGVDLIEVGHGVGLGASETGQGQARESDVTYMRAAAGAVKRAKWGMFCIPGIASLDDIARCADHGMGFIRIGVSVDRVAAAEPFVRKAKAAGMNVATNFMKSYTRPPAVFAQTAKVAASFGTDYVYVVDSAGNMTPDRVRAYVQATKSATDISLGFHAHNNLGLANANALIALELGCDLIDASLQGMGRCTGNTVTEQFVALLTQTGRSHQYDLFRLMDTSERQVRPRLTQVGHDTVDLICGYAGFHSSYMHTIRDAALDYDVDPRRLIIEVCRETQELPPTELVRSRAQAIAAADKKRGYRHQFPLRSYFGHEQDDL
jgi:4-hydroxy-2-oxovalerate aldolase